MGRGILRFAAMEDGDESLALRGVRTLVDDRLHLALALEDRAWPGIEQRGAEPVQGHVAEMALVDSHDLEAAAVAMGRSGFELARAAVVAVAVAELDAFHVPVDHAHGDLPAGATLQN